MNWNLPSEYHAGRTCFHPLKTNSLEKNDFNEILYNAVFPDSEEAYNWTIDHSNLFNYIQIFVTTTKNYQNELKNMSNGKNFLQRSKQSTTLYLVCFPRKELGDDEASCPKKLCLKGWKAFHTMRP